MENTINRYRELSENTWPEMQGCFFAFNEKQFEEGKAKNGLTTEKIYSVNGGLFGTRAGIDLYFADLGEIARQIAKECNPQEVYDYEYLNHECGYTHNDSDAIAIIERYWGAEAVKSIKRKH